MAEKQSLWNPAILRQAAFDSFRKLDPRLMVKNPVMLVVEIGSVLTTVLLIQGVVQSPGQLCLQPADHLVAVVHGAVCQFRRSYGGGPRQGPGRHAAQGQRRDHGRFA